MDSLVGTVLESVNILTKPTTRNEPKDSKHVFDLNALLVANIDSLRHYIQPTSLDVLKQAIGNKDSQADVKWHFVEISLTLLDTLNEATNKEVELYKENLQKTKVASESRAPPISPDVLSVGPQKQITALFQFVVCLGICPNLLPGVGIPLAKRSGFAQLLHDNVEVVSPELREWRLLRCMSSLLQCIQQPSLGSIILSAHLGDIIASLAQLSYGPLSRVKAVPEADSCHDDKGQEHKRSVTSNSTPADVINAVTHQGNKSKENTCGSPQLNGKEEKAERTDILSDGLDGMVTPEDRQWCKEELDQLLGRVYPPLVVREMLILQTNMAGFPKVPLWLRKFCSFILSQKLMKPRGVQFVLRGMLEGTTGSSNASDWRKCDAAAKVISNCPRSVEVSEYYSKIGPQIIDLLHIEDKKLARQFLRVATSTISAMFISHPDEAKIHLIDPLLSPLRACLKTKDMPDIEIIVEERTLTKCIEDIHKVFVSGEPQTLLLKFLKPVLPVLFELHCFLSTSVSQLRGLCEETLLRHFRHTDTDHVVDLLYNLMFNISAKMTDGGMSTNCNFVPGPNCGVQVVKSDGSEDSATNFEMKTNCIVKLFKGIDVDDITANFFLRLLQDLSDIINNETDQSVDVAENSTQPEDTLYNIEQRVNRQVEKISHGLMVVQLLAEMSEHVGPSCFKNTGHILEFAKVTLERGVFVLLHTEDEEFGLFESETVSMAMGLLTAVMSGASKVSIEDRKKLNDMLPVLDTLSKQHPDDSVREMATDLRIAIATHGHLLSDALKHAAQQKDKPKKETKHVEEAAIKSDRELVDKKTAKNQNTKSKKPLIEVISSHEKQEEAGKLSQTEYMEPNTKHTPNRTGPEEGIKEPSSSDRSEMEKAFEELMDPLIPVRGHALITLRRLLEDKNPEALEKQELLLKVFQENLDHADSYLYLAAIQGMSVLADRLPDKVLPCLVQQYSQPTEGPSSGELRIKVGEVLVKTCRNMGDMMPKYRDLFINSLLSGARDTDPLVRASAMSNLGEVCKLLHFALGSCIQEVFVCVSSLIKSDSDAEVRKASALFCTLLLQGLGQDSFKVLDSVLRDLYRVLKLAAQTEQDVTVLLHVRLALDELDQIMRQYLFPQQTLTKRIHVLDPPT